MNFDRTARLLMISMASGFFITLIWWTLFAPTNAFFAVNLYGYNWLYYHIVNAPFGPSALSGTTSAIADSNFQTLKPTVEKLGGLLWTSAEVFAASTAVSVLVLRWIRV